MLKNRKINKKIYISEKIFVKLQKMHLRKFAIKFRKLPEIAEKIYIFLKFSGPCRSPSRSAHVGGLGGCTGWPGAVWWTRPQWRPGRRWPRCTPKSWKIRENFFLKIYHETIGRLASLRFHLHSSLKSWKKENFLTFAKKNRLKMPMKI